MERLSRRIEDLLLRKIMENLLQEDGLGTAGNKREDRHAVDRGYD